MGVEVPAEVALVPRRILEDYVLRRIREFSQLFAQELSPDCSTGELERAYHATAQRLQHGRPLETESFTLRFVHRCRFLGCRSPDCPLCRHNPHKRCGDGESFDECYADHQVLRSRCDSDIFVELISGDSGRPVDVSGVEVQVCVIDGDVGNAEAGGGSASLAAAWAPAVRELFASDEGAPLLGSQLPGASKDAAGRFVLSLQDGCCRLPDLVILDKNDTFHLGSQTFGSFRLMAQALRRDAGGNAVLLQHVAPAISQKFVVKTQRALNDYRKTDYPHFKDEPTKLRYIGTVTLQRLRDIQAHVPGVPFTCIETVEQLKMLMLYADQNRHVEVKLLDLLNMKGKHKHKWDYLRSALMERIVYEDLAHRIWWAEGFETIGGEGSGAGVGFGGSAASISVSGVSSTGDGGEHSSASVGGRGLLYAAKQGHFSMDKPFGVVERVIAEGQPVRLLVTPLQDLSPASLEQARRWKAQAEEAWCLPGHRGWMVMNDHVDVIGASAHQQQPLGAVGALASIVKQPRPSDVSGNCGPGVGPGPFAAAASASALGPKHVAVLNLFSPPGSAQAQQSTLSPWASPQGGDATGGAAAGHRGLGRPPLPSLVTSPVSPSPLNRLPTAVPCSRVAAGGALLPRYGSGNDVGSASAPSRSESPQSAGVASPFADLAAGVRAVHLNPGAPGQGTEVGAAPWPQFGGPALNGRQVVGLWHGPENDVTGSQAGGAFALGPFPGQRSGSSPGARSHSGRVSTGRGRRNNGSPSPFDSLRSPTAQQVQTPFAHVLDLASPQGVPGLGTSGSEGVAAAAAAMGLSAPPVRIRPPTLDLGSVTSPKLMRSPKRDSTGASTHFGQAGVAGAEEGSPGLGSARGRTVTLTSPLSGGDPGRDAAKRARSSSECLMAGPGSAPAATGDRAGTTSGLNASQLAPQAILLDGRTGTAGLWSPPPHSRLSPSSRDAAVTSAPQAAAQHGAEWDRGRQDTSAATSASQLASQWERLQLASGSHTASTGQLTGEWLMQANQGRPTDDLFGPAADASDPEAAGAAGALPAAPRHSLLASMQQGLCLGERPLVHPGSATTAAASAVTFDCRPSTTPRLTQGGPLGQGQAPLLTAAAATTQDLNSPLPPRPPSLTLPAPAPGDSPAPSERPGVPASRVLRHSDSDSFRRLLDVHMVSPREVEAAADLFKGMFDSSMMLISPGMAELAASDAFKSLLDATMVSPGMSEVMASEALKNLLDSMPDSLDYQMAPANQAPAVGTSPPKLRRQATSELIRQGMDVPMDTAGPEFAAFLDSAFNESAQVGPGGAAGEEWM